MTDTLYIDANEPTGVQEAVIKEINKRSDIDLEIKIDGLKTGDFLLGDVVFERKEASDLAGSITDGRLREQTSRMSADFQHRYLLLESHPYDLSYSDLHPNSIVGSLVSTNCKKDVDIIPVNDYDSLAYAVYKICKIHLDGGLEAEEHHLKSTSLEKENIEVAMLSQIDGISSEKARQIMNETDIESIGDLGARVLGGHTEDLKFEIESIDGIGEVLADRIVSAFRES